MYECSSMIYTLMKTINLYINMILHTTSIGNMLSIPNAKLLDNYMSCKNIQTTAE